MKELFSGDTGGYFQREQIEAMRYMAYDKAKRGYLKDGDELDKFVFRDFNLADGVSGFRDGTQIGDVVGTLTRGITAHVKGGRVYFKAENYVTMISFAGGNLIPVQARLIDLPKSGPLSSVKTIFEWSARIPDYLKEKH